MDSHQPSRKRRVLGRLLSPIFPSRIARRIFPSTPPNVIDGDLLDTERRVTIDILPDDVLLLIFNFDRETYLHHEDVHRRWEFLRWHQLIHVCRRWRSVVFASPNFLNLRLVCGPWTSPTELTGIWPPLPIIITNRHVWTMPEYCDFDIAIVHRNRVCEINFTNLSRSQLHRLASAMQVQFPELIHLRLGFDHFRGPIPALSDGFLGGFAPRLQSLELNFIPFPALPKLLLSATDLVRLTLLNIPSSGFFSPEALVTSLAVLANLKFLTIQSEPPAFLPFGESRRLPPKRTIVPSLTRFEFQGVCEYLDDLMARIDTPLLDSLQITLFHQLIFDFSQLVRFMIHTTRFGALYEAHVNFEHSDVQVGYLPPPWIFGGDFWLRFLRLSSFELDRQLSFLTQVVTSFSPSTYMVEYLYIYGLSSQWQDDIENTGMQWLEIFHPFTSVTHLYVSWNFSQCIAFALQDLVGESATEVLPALECLYLEDLQPSGPVEEAIRPFVAARQLLGHPVAVSHWKREAL